VHKRKLKCKRPGKITLTYLEDKLNTDGLLYLGNEITEAPQSLKSLGEESDSVTVWGELIDVEHKDTTASHLRMCRAYNCRA